MTPPPPNHVTVICTTVQGIQLNVRIPHWHAYCTCLMSILKTTKLCISTTKYLTSAGFQPLKTFVTCPRTSRRHSVEPLHKHSQPISVHILSPISPFPPVLQIELCSDPHHFTGSGLEPFLWNGSEHSGVPIRISPVTMAFIYLFNFLKLLTNMPFDSTKMRRQPQHL